MKKDVETVSIGIVALNEEEYLPKLLIDIKNQNYPREQIELVLIDSGSSDSTKKIMEEFKKNNDDYKSIKVLDNPKKRQAPGWNVAIKNFTGDVLFRIDAHTKIPSDFISKNVNVLNSGEDVSGGLRPCIIINENSWTKTLLNVENSVFGSSINRKNKVRKKEYVDTMFHAAYRKEVFQKVGFFNDNLGRTEDNEFHYRVRRAGYKFCMDPSIISYQYSRSSLKKFLKQKFFNGYWVGLTLGVCPNCLSLFHFVPFFFLLAIVISLGLSFSGYSLLLYLISSVYIIFTVVMTLKSIKDDGITKFFWAMPMLFLLLHLSYGLGTLKGLLEMPFKRKSLTYKG